PASGVAEGGQAADVPRRGGVTAGTIDLLGILSASQALSSETSVDRLHARVVEVLSAMTGATGVLLVLWDEDRQDWALPGPADGEAAAPLSVLRYLRRTQEPLAVGDAPVMTGSPVTRTSRAWRAVRCWPCRCLAAEHCGRCCWWRTG